MNTKIHTKFGKATLQKHGYYVITSRKEGNEGERLHRLIWESVWGKIPKNWVIHHLDGDKTNNCILNLYGMDKSYHDKLHNSNGNNPRCGTHHTEETKQKISKAHMGKKLSQSTKQKLREINLGKKQSLELVIKRNKMNNKLGIFRVIKHKHKTTKQGFNYVYTYTENGKSRELHSIDICKLKEKVIERGLEWIIVDEEKVKKTFDEKTADKIINSISNDTYEN